MAVYNEIGIGRWNRFIQKLTDMKGGPPARQLSSEIQFAHGIFHGCENRYLEQWERFGILINQNAVAAQSSDFRLRNPAGSNVVAVVESIIVANTNAATAFQVFVENGRNVAGDLAVIVGNANSGLDNRGRATPTLISSTTNNGAGLGAAFMVINLLANVTAQMIVTDNQEVPILPGSAIQVSTNTVNVSLGVSMIWRERFLEPAERF